MLRFATIGTGWITDEYIAGAKSSGLWELSAVYSREENRGREYAKKHGARLAFTDLSELAACKEIDAVYVASPNALHYEHSKLLLEHGKHVICEKPLCAQAWKVKELQEIARRQGAIFLEAIMFLHLPQRALLEQALKKIGKISMVKLDFCQRSSKLNSYLGGELPNIFNPKLETGAWMDLGVYCAFPALYLFGKPETFHVDTVFMESGADGSGVISMKYPDKTVVLTYSKLGQSGANSDFQGTEGTVAVESISKLTGISLCRRDEPSESLFGDMAKSDLMGFEAKDLYRFITEPEASHAEYHRCSSLSLEVSEFMEAVRAKTGILFDSDK